MARDSEQSTRRELFRKAGVAKMRDQGVNLLFLSGNSVCWVSPFRPSEDGRQNRILFRGGPYGGDYQWAKLREAQHGAFPHRGPDEGNLLTRAVS
jgi:hypothetical protein